MSDTIFDKILRREIPAEVVFENEDVLAFEDIHAAAKVHVLVIPKKKLVSFSDFKDADPLEVGKYMKNVAKVARELGLNEGGYRVLFNCGKHGNQTVDYLHAHILGGEQLRGF